MNFHNENNEKLENLLALIVCPYCKSDIQQINKVKIICKECGRFFEVKDNIPIMLTEESKNEIKRFYGNEIIDSTKYKKRADFKKIKHLVEPPARIRCGDNRSAKLKKAWDEANKARKKNLIHTLVIGNLRMNQNTESAKNVKSIYTNNAIHLDIHAKNQTDIVADGYRLPFPDNTFNLIVAQATMKHMANPKKFLKEVYRVLDNKGVFYSEYAYFLMFHRWPGDYFRFTPLGIKELLKDFKVIEMGPNRGPSYVIVEVLSIYIGSLLSFNNKYLFSFFRIITGWILHPLRFLDLYLLKIKWSDLMCQVNYCIAKKNKNES